jgi:hypothetical protein
MILIPLTGNSVVRVRTSPSFLIASEAAVEIAVLIADSRDDCAS